MNQKIARTRAACVASLLLFIPLLIMGLRTMAKYRYAVDDWHYEVALAGSIVTVVMITVGLIGILLSFRFTRA